MIKRFGKLVVHNLRPVLILMLGLFYEKSYLKSKYFNQHLSGFVWAFRSIWTKNILRLAKPLPWPSALTCYVSNAKNIVFHPDDLNNFQSPGTYFQNFGACIYIGKGTYIAPNVGLITSNHDTNDLERHEGGLDVIIGEKCWIGMNAVILPGVVLGSKTIVAAGAVVAKSFPDGYIVIGGVPARELRRLENPHADARC
ncbi:acyltransferase [Rhodanobacter sp. Root561]|uniref:acyltransferase n=1 Tax=Rhodanobacter sp. Root561 TaxID=1736560 RepID=UPI0009EB6A38|nr:acyltransferase [Rhodanobacter sp. Root561]